MPVRRAGARVTITVVADEHLPGRDGGCRWTEALGEAAETTVFLYVRESAEKDEAERARAFAQVHPQCRTSQVEATPHGAYRELW